MKQLISDVRVPLHVSREDYDELLRLSKASSTSMTNMARALLERALHSAVHAGPDQPPRPCASLAHASNLLTDDALRRSMKPFRVAPYGRHKFRYGLSQRPGEYNRSVLAEFTKGKWERCSRSLTTDVQHQIFLGKATYVVLIGDRDDDDARNREYAD